MAYSTILYRFENGAGRLTLNRPDRLNAFTKEMHAEVSDCLDRFEDTATARVLLITGAGRAFCAGQDLAERRRAPGDPPYDLGESVELRYNPLIRRLTNLNYPVVCAVNGVAAGAGANIALAGDIVIAKTSAKFIQSFVNVGLAPDAGGTWVLPRLVGMARALGLALTAEPLDAETAQAWGLIWRAVQDDNFETEVETLVARLAKAPTRALAAAKKALRQSSATSLDAQLDIERDMQRELGMSADYAEGVAAFNEKRSPAFRGI